ncbi:MAG: HlyD family secretion protein [Verrucomicrobia bacterium]|nr:HlyD family secretion protein [Verrucomicrobiota bacterium]
MIHQRMVILLWIWMGVHSCIEVRCQDAGGIILSPRQMNDLGIELIEAEKMVFEDRLFVLGRAETAETRKAVVSSRVAGRIVELMAHPGDKVAPGQSWRS